MVIRYCETCGKKLQGSPDSDKVFCSVTCKKSHDKQFHMYFIECNGFVKIGRAKNVGQRLAEMQTGNPYEMRVWKIFYDKGYLEQQVHKVLQVDKVRGKWFKITELTNDVIRMLETNSFF